MHQPRFIRRFDLERASKRTRLNDRTSLRAVFADIRSFFFLYLSSDKGAEVSIGEVEAREGAGTRIGRPIFVPYRSAQFTLRGNDKQACSIGRERERKRRKGGEEPKKASS